MSLNLSISRLGLGGGRGGAAPAPSVPDFWVDSVGGSDSNAGTEAAPFQTLAKAVTEINAFGNGCHVRFKGNSFWRESFAPTPDNLIVDWDGTGTPPVISGFDVQTTWVDDTATVAGRWYKDVTHDTNSTNRQVVIEDGVMLNRVASAAAVTTAGTYFSADCGTANPIRVYINVGAENPNSSGKVYEVTTRLRAIELGDNCTITGIVARGAISNNGPLIVGTGCTVTRCVAAYGTKHNYLIEDGLMEDCVAVINDAPTATEPSTTIGVAFKPDTTGLNVTLRRVFTKGTQTGVMFFSHSSNSSAHANVTIEQCAWEVVGNGNTGGAVVNNMTNCASLGTGSPFNGFGSTSATLTRVLALISTDTGIANGSSLAPLNVSQCALVKTTGSTAQGVIQTVGERTITVENTSIDTASGNFANTIRWVSGTTGSLVFNENIIVANNALRPASSATYTADGNTFGTRNIGPFATWTDGTFNNLATDMAGWRTKSGQDATSAGAVSVYYTGTTSNGDFRQSGALSGSGVTEHWNFNTRAVVSSPPERFPTIPQTYAEAITYITDPTAWDFYP